MSIHYFWMALFYENLYYHITTFRFVNRPCKKYSLHISDLTCLFHYNLIFFLYTMSGYLQKISWKSSYFSRYRMVPGFEQPLFPLLHGQYISQNYTGNFTSYVTMIHCLFTKASNKQSFVKRVESRCLNSGVIQWWIKLHVCDTQEE